MTPYSEAEQAILNHPDTTPWLKARIRELHNTDPKTSATDCAVLAEIQAQRCMERGIQRRGQ